MITAISKPLHTISVRDLVEFVLRSGDLGGEREFGFLTKRMNDFGFSLEQLSREA